MAIPDFQSLMLPVLEYSAGGEKSITDTVGYLAEKLNLTQEERNELLPSGKQAVFRNRVGWAKAYLLKAGLLESTRRAHFQISPRGREVLQQTPARIDMKFLDQFEEYRQWQAGEGGTEIIAKPDADSEHTPDETMRLAHQQIEASLAQELLDRILSSPPSFFEKLIINLLISMGYGGSTKDAGRALGKSGDDGVDGVDGVIDQDALGLDRVYVQAKRYSAGNNIGSGAIRDFFGSLDRHKAAKGLFVTTSGFSPSARETAEYLSKRIVLIDGSMLAKLMIRYNVGCRIEETIYLKKVDEEFFE